MSNNFYKWVVYIHQYILTAGGLLSLSVYVKSSYRTTPKLQMSDPTENLLSVSDSGAYLYHKAEVGWGSRMENLFEDSVMELMFLIKIKADFSITFIYPRDHCFHIELQRITELFALHSSSKKLTKI